MNKHIIILALVAGLAACSGGNPFNDPTDTTDVTDVTGDPDAADDAVPEVLAGNLSSFTFNPDDQTLTVTGVPTDDGTLTGVYRRRPGLDRAGYEAYTAQDGSLDRHSTAFVRDIRGTRAATVVTGGQFQQFFAGGAFSNTTFSAPVERASEQDGGLVTYAGGYVGLLNAEGSGEDLLAVAPGTDESVLPVQAAEITGQIIITGDFQDSSVTGVIFNRVLNDVNNDTLLFDPNSDNPVELEDIALDSTPISENGVFSGITSQGNSPVGEYAGIFGGVGATEVAGVQRSTGHIRNEVAQNPIENGVFVLSQCGQADEDPLCNQPFE